MALNNPYALNFDSASNQYATIPHLGGFFSTGNDFSISFYYKLEDTSSRQTLMNFLNETSLAINTGENVPNDVVHLRVEISGTWKNILVDPEPSMINEWYHIIFSFSTQNGWKMFKNGLLIDSNTENTAPDPISLDQTNNIGCFNYANSGYLKGSIDDIVVWKKSFNEDDAVEIYNRLLVDENDKKLHYRLDSGSGTTLVDSSPNGNHGSIDGANWVQGEVDLIGPNINLLKSDNELFTYKNNQFIKTTDYENDGLVDLSPIITPANSIKYDMNYNKDESGGKVFKKEINKDSLKSIKSGKFSFNL